MDVPPGFVNLVFAYMRAGDNEAMINGLGFAWDGSTPYQDIVNDAFDAWADSDLQGDTTSTTSLVRVTGEFGTIGTGNLVIDSSRTPAAGSSGEEALPSNCAILVKKLTGLGGRANRGRLYYPDARKDHVNVNGLMDDTWIAQMQDDFEGWLTAVRGVTGLEEAVLFHADPEVAPTELTAIVVQPQIATQRRRMRP